MTTEILDTPTTCCGKDSWTTAGATLVNSCKLCPSSSTYWHLTSTTLNQPAAAPKRGCIRTRAEHAETWRSWRDNCAGPGGCGFSMVDVQQCMTGHPEDGVKQCGVCGHGSLGFAA
jgi:hypothetical protein